MPTYTCDICQTIFQRKSNYDSHKARKRPCKKNEVVTTLQTALQTAGVPVPTKSLAETTMAKPILKWVGGKTQILQQVLELFPKEMTNYHEPFLGGGSVLLGLLTCVKEGLIKVTGTIYASDLNGNLIGLYKNIQSQPDALIAQIRALVDEFSKIKGTAVNRKPATHEEALTSPESYYYWIRGRFNELSAAERGSVTGSAMLLFMNKTCFRGVYREGPHGFNVPFGHYKNPGILDEEHLRAVSALIQGVVFTVSGFGESLTRCTAGDFAYLDPPYAPVDEKSFVSYTADGFDLAAHTELFKACVGLAARNVKMLMSNADVNLVKNAFPTPTYTTKIISCRRAINSTDPSERANEVLITS